MDCHQPSHHASRGGLEYTHPDLPGLLWGLNEGRVWYSAISLVADKIEPLGRAMTSLGAQLPELLFKMGRVVNWRVVRAFGALTALTRASYAMLVVVPLMAGVWPMVQSGIEETRRALVRHGDEISIRAERVSGQLGTLETQLATTVPIFSEALNKTSTDSEPSTSQGERRLADLVKAGPKLADETRKLSNQIHGLAASLPKAMPSAWGFAFFAALAVALGQFFYQTSAPEIIRRYTLEEYQESKANPVGRAPTTDEIHRAASLIRAAAEVPGTFLYDRITPCVRQMLFFAYGLYTEAERQHQSKSGNLNGERHVPTAKELGEAAETDVIKRDLIIVKDALEKEGVFYVRQSVELLKQHEYFSRAFSMLNPNFKDDILMYMLNRNFKDDRIHTPFPPFESLIYVIDNLVAPMFGFETEIERTAHNREMVWIGARVEYLDKARLHARGRCFVSMAFYGCASLLIAWITYTQARSVAEAVGWLHS